jgi:oligoribonuclease (3'-5' exoribonuclease)
MSAIVWMDMEMSGLEPDKERILEVAVLVTDGEPRVRTWSFTSRTKCWTRWTSGIRGTTVSPG